MILKTVTGLALRLTRREDAPERLLIVEPTCQSDLKRVLRRCGVRPDTVTSRGFLDDLATSSARMVNTGFHLALHGFELVDTGTGGPRRRRINGKFTRPGLAKILA